MAHARVSPEFAILGTEMGISEGSVRSAEEFRVNQLVRTAGFDINLLVDGSEKLAGQRLAEMEDHAGLVHFIAATAGTEGAKAFLRGVRSVDPALAKALRELEKSIIKMWTASSRRSGDRITAKRWGDTRLVSNEEKADMGYTVGYLQYTIPLAKMLDEAIDALMSDPDVTGEDGADDDIDSKEPFERIKEAVKGNRGRWGKLVIDPEIRPTKPVRGTLGKKRSATNMGRNPRRINRMLTDPQRRVFDKVTRGIGGIVIIDQSGSMSLSIEDVESIMVASPGCTIIGYSHRAGSVDLPNIWVLAEDGKRSPVVRKGQGGNGVDIPALKFATSKATRGESIVWVCDGCVTSGDDDLIYENLDEEAARFVKRNKIHMVKNVSEALDSLRRLSNGETLETRYVGNVKVRARGLGYL
jgi:hypothetical protein